MAIHTGLTRGEAVSAPAGWFAAAVPVTIGYLALSAVVASTSGQTWLGAIVGVALVALTGLALVLRRNGESLIGYLGGTAVTIAGLYAAVTIAAELSLHQLGG